jgi:hypothetical protein
MDQNSIEYKISVMQAFKEGKQLQSKIYKDSVLSNDWKSIDTPIWDWYRCDYRVKPDEKTEYQKEVEQAFKEGKQIQAKYFAYNDNNWNGVDAPKWNWKYWDYRVKPDEKTEYQKEVEQAFYKGLTIQFKRKTQTGNRWTVCFDPSWDWDTWSYRVLPGRIHLYQWAYKFDGLWRIHNVFAGGNIEDIKEELKRVLFSNSLKGVEDYKRLDYTKIIVDEE